MKKVLIVIAIVLCFAVFAISCGTNEDDPAKTTGGTAQKLTGDNVIDWGELTGTTAKSTATKDPSATTGSGSAKKTTAVSTEKLPEKSWAEGTDDPNGGWSTMAPVGG